VCKVLVVLLSCVADKKSRRIRANKKAGYFLLTACKISILCCLTLVKTTLIQSTLEQSSVSWKFLTSAVLNNLKNVLKKRVVFFAALDFGGQFSAKLRNLTGITQNPRALNYSHVILILNLLSFFRSKINFRSINDNVSLMEPNTTTCDVLVGEI